MDAGLFSLYPKWFGGGEKKRPDRKGDRKPEKLKSIAQSVQDVDKYWNDLIYTVCNKDPGQMREIVKMDVFEFFGFVDNFMKGK